MIGICYADESGAAQMYKKVNNRAKYGTWAYMAYLCEILIGFLGFWFCKEAYKQARLVKKLGFFG